jgi:hypothetical protein
MRLLPFVVLLIASSDQARAAIIFEGKTIGYQYIAPRLESVYFDHDMTVGAGVERTELYNFGTYATVDVSDANITIDYYRSVRWNNFPFNGLRFFDKYGVLPAFSSVSINSATNLSGFSQSNITFDENSIYVNWRGLSANPSTILSLDVGRATPILNAPVPTLQNSVVPEPASLAIFSMTGIGVAAGAYCRNKRPAK